MRKEEEVELGDGWILYHASGSRDRSTTLIQTELSQQLLDGLTLAEISMVP